MQKPISYVVVLVVLTVLTACAEGAQDAATSAAGDDQESATYEGNGVTFDYPADWTEAAAGYAASTGSDELWSAAVGPDESNLVIINAYRLNIPVTEENLASIKGELNGVIEAVVRKAGGQITTGPIAAEIAGFPAYTYTWEGVEVNGEPKDSSAYFLFDGDIEYYFNCQFSDDAAEEVKAGCDQVLESFEVTDRE